MSRFTAPTLLASAVVLTTGACAFDVDGVDDRRPLEARLATRAFLELQPSTAVGVCAHDPSGNELPYVEPSVAGGRAVLRTTADGWLLVEDLEVALDDVTIPAGVLRPRPLVLTDVQLRLGTQIAVAPWWSEAGDAAWGTGTADILLDWSLVLDDGSAYPLATQLLAEAEFAVSVAVDAGGRITAAVHTAVPGEVHQLTGLVTLSDLSVSVDAATAI
jgi:hypothetical protein